MNRLPLLLLPLALAAAPAFAQDQPAGPPDANAPDLGKDSVTIGIAGVYMPDYEGSNDYRIYPAPGALVSVHGFNLTLAGNRASLDLIPNKPGPTWDVQAGPIVVMDLNRSTLSQISDLRVRRLGKRSTTYEVGGFLGIGKTGVITSPYDKLSVSVSYRKGVNAAHHAGIFSPSLNYLTPLSHKVAVGLLASAEYAERGYAHAYFDIDGTQSAHSGLPVYTAQGGWKSYTLGVIGTQAITGDLLHGFKLVEGITYKRLLNDFADSPVVSVAGSKSQVQAIAGLAYTF